MAQLECSLGPTDLKGHKMLKHLTIAALLALAAAPAYASSEDAWDEFAQEVGEACTAATRETFATPEVVVDPFGSESFGLAVVSGDTVTGERKSIICVFDKETKAVEIGGEIDLGAPQSES